MTLRGWDSGKCAPPMTSAMLAARGGMSHGSWVSTVRPAMMPSATRPTTVSTAMTRSFCLGGAELTYQRVLVSVCVTSTLEKVGRRVT